MSAIGQPIVIEPPEPTLKQIGEQAKAKADSLLDTARTALQGAEEALKEASATPLFGNGLASGMKDALRHVEELDAKLQGLRTRLDEHFRPPPPPKDDRTAAMRGEA